MTDDVQRFIVQRVTGQGRSDVEEAVARELPLTIRLNGRDAATLMCSPSDLEALAAGFLFSAGRLNRRDEIREIVVEPGVVRVETTAGPDSGLPFPRPIAPGGLARVESKLVIPAAKVFRLVRGFESRSRLYQATGGTHSAALCDTEGVVAFAEDVARHNAIDKVFGHCLLEGIAAADRIMVASCRLSSEIMLKVARGRVPIIVSVSAPTDAGINLASDAGITLVGFVRGRRMNIYTNGWRIV